MKQMSVTVVLDLNEQRKLKEVTEYFNKLSFSDRPLTPSTILVALLELTHMRMQNIQIIESIKEKGLEA